MSAVRVLEYLDPQGRSPWAAWFNGLNAQAAAKVSTALYRLAEGNFSNVKGVGGGVFERKIDFGPGYRIYFGKDGDAVVILVGGSTKQRQHDAIAAARERWNDYRRRKGYDMALTRDFRETIRARAQREPRYREALFTEAINAYLAGDPATGKSILRDLVNPTVGFEGLASQIKKPSKSLHRMLAPHGNPSTENFFGIVNALQKKTRVKLRVTAKAA